MARERRQFSEAEIVAAYDDGRLLDLVVDEFRGAEPAIIATHAAICAGLHNSGRVDILSLAQDSAFEVLTQFQFYATHHFFEPLIPQIAAPVLAMVAFVDRLVAKGGTDGAAGWPKNAFEVWCAQDPARIEAVLDAARRGDAVATRVLDAALTADGRKETALRFLDEGPAQTWPMAIHALGRLKLPTKDKASVLAQLDREFPSPPGDLAQAQRIEVAIKLAEAIGEDAGVALELVLRRSLVDAEPLTLNAAARALWLDRSALPDPLVTVVLEALAALDPSYGAIVANLDHGLAALLKESMAEEAIGFVERYVARHDSPLEYFDRFLRDLLSGEAERRDRVFVRWMIGDVQRMAQGCADALRGREMAGEPISLGLSDLGLTARQAVRLCKRAVGYFFVQPVTAASILVAVLRKGPPEAVEAAGELLFDPLLINYGGKTREYLLTVGADDPAHAAIQRALRRADAYVEALRSVGDIKELHPPELHLIIAQRLHQETMRKARKEADEQSAFKDIFTNSLILHGPKVRSWRVGPEGKRQAFDMVLQTHGFSMELPRTEVIDPVDLDYRLRRYCLENDEDEA
jgi:hypothetical protein